ncbi:HEAT repeat domain-containing protein [Undibacterium sp. Ji83W]|uniref:HEAT repeat domain-containing protein n=1 Tax=Undibacterium sp. Ji83W TaxID=3413043 RepID=UPI003BF1A528
MYDEHTWMQNAIAEFAHADTKQKIAYLENFYLRLRPLPIKIQTLICDVAGQSPPADNDGDQMKWRHAIIGALSRCDEMKQPAIALLCNYLYSSIWHLRGSAAISLGKLGVDDTAIISRIGDLLSDHEGNDEFVHEYALIALTHLGRAGRQELSKILDLANNFLLEEGNGWDNSTAYLPDCLANLEVRTPEVFDILCSIVREHRYFSHDACLALALLDAPAELAKPAIAGYLLSDEFYIYEASKLHELINALINVAEGDHAIIMQCLEHLCNDCNTEMASIAWEYLDRMRRLA